MYQHVELDRSDKAGFYAGLLQVLDSVLRGEADPISNLANTAALLYDQLPRLNWAGFYLLKKDELIVGPFQGKPACSRIALGRGVCGTAARERRTIVVPDVHAFPGHIACDPASRAELVVPMIDTRARLIGVLDLDSPDPGRFTHEDAQGLEALVRRLLSHCAFGD